MALTILNNIAALAAENQLNITSNSLNSTLEQLSSGSRINSGADDPAGLAIANGLQANIAALTQSASNATDGVGELQVADGALSQVTTLLDRAVTLATESATGTVSNSQRGALDAEYQSIKAEINSIGSTTNFNGGQVFTNNTLNVFLSDGSTSGSSTIGVSTGLLSSTQLTLGGTPATATLGEATASSSANATDVLTGGTFVGSTQANALLTASTQFNALTNATATLTGGAFTNSTQATDSIVGSTTAAFVGSTTATSTLTTTGTITNGDTVAVGGTTYTFVTAASAGSGPANQVLVAGGFAALEAAVNGTGVNGFTGADFAANTEVAASGSGAATITFTAKNAGAGGNAAVAAVYTGVGDGTDTAGVTAVTGNTVTVAGQVYQLVAALSTTPTANEVVVGTGAATGNNETTLTNLEAAINNGPAGTGAGTLYATGTAANTSVTAGGTPASGTLTLTAKVNGTGGNALTATTNAGAGVGAAFPVAFTGGTNGSTVTIGTQTYTFVTALSSNAGGTANEILGGTEANDLTYLAQAVNNVTTAGTIGTTYSTGTVINPFVTAGTPTSTQLTFTSKVAGAGSGSGGTATGNNIAVSTSGVGNFASATLTGGTAASQVTVGNQTYTFATAAQLNSSAYNVLINTTASGTAAQILGSLQNLADAINGTGAGTNYSSGAANSLATAAAPVQGSGNTSTLALTAQVNGLGTSQAGTGNFTVASTAYTANGFGGNANGFGGTSTTFANGSVGDSVNVGGQVYNFVTALSTNGGGATVGGTANEVLVGGSVQSDLANLVAAVQGGTGAGTTYGLPTVTNASASAVAGTTTATFTAKIAGTAGNSIVASTSGGIGNFATPDFTGGSVQQSQGGPAVAGDTVTVGSQTYTFVNTINANSPAYSVLVGAGTGAASETASLTNLAAAVNGATGSGVTYGLLTSANTSAEATLQSSTPGGPVNQVLFTALTGGTAGNSIVSASTGGDNTFTGALFTGGGAATNDLLTSSDATAALTQINDAVATVAALRGNIGATVNRLQAASSVITNQTQNLTSAENDVTAADIPTVVANLSQYSILEQTGVSALAQANQQQQLVLKLLQ